MANEIKVLSQSNGGDIVNINCLFYYSIPAGQRITNPVTSNPFVVNPTADMDADTLALLDATAGGERDKLNAGEALLWPKTIQVSRDSAPADVLSDVQGAYVREQSKALAWYIGAHKWKFGQYNAA